MRIWFPREILFKPTMVQFFAIFTFIPTFLKPNFFIFLYNSQAAIRPRIGRLARTVMGCYLWAVGAVSLIRRSSRPLSTAMARQMRVASPSSRAASSSRFAAAIIESRRLVGLGIRPPAGELGTTNAPEQEGSRGVFGNAQPHIRRRQTEAYTTDCGADVQRLPDGVSCQ